MVVSVDVFHEPFDMKNVMGDIKPSIKDKQVNKRLFNNFNQPKLVLTTSPVPIVRKVLIDQPKP